MAQEEIEFVEETRFGVWFLGTKTWHVHVLQRALDDLERLLQPHEFKFSTILDVGCGQGKSLLELAKRFQPQQLYAVDIDPAAQHRVADSIKQCPVPVTFYSSSATQLPLADNSVDMLFCHQTLHHIVFQEEALREFMRVLKPEGVLLLAESTRKYIYSWIIRLLFRHPMQVQRSADEYLAMIRAVGFEVSECHISLPYLWWSRNDLGMFEWLGFLPSKNRQETLLNLVGVKANKQ